MELVHCIYTSSVTEEYIAKESLEEILTQSRENNKKLGVTGILLHHSGTFFQVLEGNKNTVESLYKKIEKDPRHNKITKLILEPIEERSFGEWSMGYPRVTKRDLEKIPGVNDFFSQGKSFIELEEGRAKKLLTAFQKGKWRL